MEVQMQAAAIVLALAAVGGLTLAVIRLRGAPWPPHWLVHLHGAVAATGVILLAQAAATAGIPLLAKIALVIFILAALGGATLFLAFHRLRKPLPIPLVLGHGSIAVTGFVLLLLSYFGIA
jgi:hypothetical protein